MDGLISVDSGGIQAALRRGERAGGVTHKGLKVRQSMRKDGMEAPSGVIDFKGKVGVDREEYLNGWYARVMAKV